MGSSNRESFWSLKRFVPCQEIEGSVLSTWFWRQDDVGAVGDRGVHLIQERVHVDTLSLIEAKHPGILEGLQMKPLIQAKVYPCSSVYFSHYADRLSFSTL